MTNINDYLRPGACVPVDSDTTIALVEAIERLRIEVEQLRVDKAFCIMFCLGLIWSKNREVG